MVRGSCRSVRGLLAAVAAVFVCAFQPAAPTAMAASSGLSYSSAGTWTVDPRLGRIHVDLQVQAVSLLPDTGGRRYFFPGLQLTLPLSTRNYSATDAQGNDLPVTVQATTAAGVVVDVAFSQRLYAGQSVFFDLRFDLVDLGGSTDRDLRIGQDLISFPVRGYGSPGTPGSSVSVIFPSGFVVQEQFGSLTSQIGDAGETIFTSGPVPDASDLNAWFTASRNLSVADFLVDTVAVGPITVTLRYWSDDPGWANQLRRVLVVGYPILRAMTGLGDPHATKLTIEEATTQGIGGFSGEYDVASSRVAISYFADPIVILHELAHLWFNENLASDRWINEGFASYYAERAVLQMGLPDHAPALGPSLMAAAEPLNAWADTGPGSATEAYLYGASLQAARAIADRAGAGGLAWVWAQARQHTAAYAAAADGSEDLPAGGLTDWRRLLDYLENGTGKSYTDIWRKWVVEPSQIAMLSDRNAARADYQAVEGQMAGWLMPPDVRSAMGSWQFASAEVLLGRARNVLALRQQIADLASGQGTTPPVNLQATFEGNGTYAALQEANLELRALGEMSEAERARAQSQGAVRAVGLLGTDPEAALDAARDAFSKGDVERALSLAESARSAWAGAGGAGQLRILGTLSGAGGALLLLAIYIWTRAGRRQSERAKPNRRDPAPSVDA
jgi:hypothetical protein